MGTVTDLNTKILAVRTDNDTEGQATGFHGNFIGDQLSAIVQVTDDALKSIKVRSPSLIAIKQAMEAGVLTNQTLMLHNGCITKEKVQTLLPFPGAWVENLL